MLVMPSNSTGDLFDRLDAQYPGQLAHLVGIGGFRSTICGDFAIDNGAFPAFTSGKAWQNGPLLNLCDQAERYEAEHGIAPRWVACPDVVGDRAATLELWQGFAPWYKALYGWPLALVVQDGMTPADVQALDVQPDVLFVGGSADNRTLTGWKWDTLATWCAAHPRVHVGRVNNFKGAVRAYHAGAESVDGTGWMCTDRQRAGLVRFLAYQQSHSFAQAA
jgi:hypothetical protein